VCPFKITINNELCKISMAMSAKKKNRVKGYDDIGFEKKERDFEIIM
jgi:hypothetical protein